MQKSESIAELAKALSKTQGEIKGALKDSENPFYKSTYADLASGWAACRDALSKNGLAIIQSPGYDFEHNVVSVETLLCHSSGEWQSSMVSAIPVKELSEYVDNKKTIKEVESRTPQAIGSCITYLRRYALFATVGIAPEDDDGNAASGKPAIGTQEASNYVAEQKLSALQKQATEREKQVKSKFGEATTGKSAEEFISSHSDAQAPALAVTGVLKELKTGLKTKSGKPMATAMVGTNKIHIFHEKLPEQLKEYIDKEVTVSCKRSADGKFLNAEEILGAVKIEDSDLPF